MKSYHVPQGLGMHVCTVAIDIWFTSLTIFGLELNFYVFISNKKTSAKMENMAKTCSIEAN